MLKYSFLLLISFTSLAFISLPNNLISDFKDRKINKFLIFKLIKLISSFIFILTFLQILSFKFFIISNILKPLIYIVYTKSLLRSTIIILSYFLTSSFLNIFINNNFEINLLLTQQNNANLYLILCFIYLILNLLTFSNSFTSNLLFLYEKYPQSLTLRVLLSILLSARFNFSNKNYLFISILIGFISPIFITISAYNLTPNMILIILIGILTLASIVYVLNILFFKDINKKISKGLIETANIFINDFLDNTNKRVFVAIYCFKKDKNLSMLSDIIKLQHKNYEILGGGYSKNIVLLHPDKNSIYKVFGSKDDNAESYYKYHLFKGFTETFNEYQNKVFYHQQKRIKYIQIPFFEGKTAFEQFCYYGTPNISNKNKIDLMLKVIFKKMKELHAIKTLNEQKYFSNNKLMNEDLINYIELKFLNNTDQLLNNKIFKDNNKTILELRNSLSNLSKEWDESNQKIVFTHGDLSFSNIIISPIIKDECSVNFIDPNPSNLFLFPSPIVDISKLLQSTCVMWELATKTNDYLIYGIKNTKGIFTLPQPYYFNYAEKKIRNFARDLGYSNKIQDLHLLIHLKRILPYISKSKTLKKYITGYIYFILFDKY